MHSTDVSHVHRSSVSERDEAGAQEMKAQAYLSVST